MFFIFGWNSNDIYKDHATIYIIVICDNGPMIDQDFPFGKCRETQLYSCGNVNLLYMFGLQLIPSRDLCSIVKTIIRT